MLGRRFCSGTALAVALIAPAAFASAQTRPAAPTPVPASRAAEENAAIVKPLSEIGRVRSRTPYCGALARARAGIDAAITFEYTTPILAHDLQSFRLDSHLTRAQSMKKTERDLTGMWNLAVAGRDDVRALRAAATAEPDAQKRQEMIDFADALDGAKARQMLLAKSMARIYAALAEAPVRDIANAPSDDHGAAALPWKIAAQHPTSPLEAAPPPKVYTSTTADAMADAQQMQELFSTFTAERYIREDLKKAALHGNNAMQLGSCNTI
ncbi:MAG TPA: hypothetical protein VGC72_01555 [Candidatus Elarobacter sp.]|jgi:hypothetical protein